MSNSFKLFPNEITKLNVPTNSGLFTLYFTVWEFDESASQKGQFPAPGKVFWVTLTPPPSSSLDRTQRWEQDGEGAVGTDARGIKVTAHVTFYVQLFEHNISLFPTCRPVSDFFFSQLYFSDQG